MNTSDRQASTKAIVHTDLTRIIKAAVPKTIRNKTREIKTLKINFHILKSETEFIVSGLQIVYTNATGSYKVEGGIHLSM